VSEGHPREAPAAPAAETEGAPPDDGRDLAAELASMEDRYKRALADLDNYRKRMARDAEQRIEERTHRLIRDWLEPLDSVERAVRMDPDSPCTPGLRAVLEQMEQVLAREGVQRIDATGTTFDPARHEAVEVRDADGVPDHTVLDVARSGFQAGDRVLRPAQVVVARRRPDA
jgi:molecular chaperone GrpE